MENEEENGNGSTSDEQMNTHVLVTQMYWITEELSIRRKYPFD